MRKTIIIPARYDSSRLPGKLLKEIAGKTILQRVFEQCSKVSDVHVLIATDDARIESHARSIGARVMMTSSEHRSGTERITEVAGSLNLHDDDIVVNVQADEPFIPPENIVQVIASLEAHADASMSSLFEPINQMGDVFDPHAVKVVTDANGYALYFSRAPIPWDRDMFACEEKALPQEMAYLRHVGLYAYRAGFLKQYVKWPACPLEKIESLEQLRAMYYGHKIHLSKAMMPSGIGIDTPEDLRRAIEAM